MTAHHKFFDGEKLRRLREARGLNQTQLAHAAMSEPYNLTSLSPYTIARHEKGTTPSTDTLRFYYAFLGGDDNAFFKEEQT